MLNQPPKIKTKPCRTCGQGLPIYSPVSSRLCATCKKCPTCGNSFMRHTPDEVTCPECGDSWEDYKKLEAAIVKTHRAKCVECSSPIEYQVLHLDAKLCKLHFSCPSCRGYSLQRVTASQVKVYYQCTECSWRGTARQVERQYKPTVKKKKKSFFDV